MILRDVDHSGNMRHRADATYYHLTDAQFSTVAIIDDSAVVQERVTYSAYGRARHHWMADVDGDGDVDATDVSIINTIASGGENAIGEDDYRAEADLNRDGIVNSADGTIATSFGARAALRYGDLTSPGTPTGLPPGSGIDNTIGFDGYVFNPECDLYAVRFRWFSPELGRWLERDPLGYSDTMQMYEYAISIPTRFLDPMGLQAGMLGAARMTAMKQRFEECVSECMAACPDVRVFKHAYGSYGMVDVPDLACVDRCKRLCRCPDEVCKPKGKLIWGPITTQAGSSYIRVNPQVVGEDMSCCSEIAAVQFVRHKDIFGWSDWEIDAGKVGALSDDSPAPPYYYPPTRLYDFGKGGQGQILFDDHPWSYLNRFWQFKLVVMCVDGPASGHVYGVFEWNTGTGFYGVWQNASGVPIHERAVPANLPELLRDRCCK